MSWLQQVWIDFWQYTKLYPLEGGLVVIVAIVACLPPVRSFRVWVPLSLRLRGLAASPRASMAALSLFTIAGHLALESYRFPVPAFHDEYSYLLAADTFASGRLTNPPHPMAYFFESFHIQMEPTYMSMYPPGQGLALALGQVVGGHPAAGVWIACGALSAASYWMLLAWAPPYWALAGGLLAAVRIGWFSYWGNSYWGGAVPAFGGMLLLGAAGRLIRREHHPALGVWLALGTVILIYTRIWEGTILAATVLGWLLVLLLRKRILTKGLRPVLIRFFAVGLAGAAFLGLYNWRVTGSPLRLAYLENRDRYEVYPSFIWQSPREDRVYNHDVMRKFYVVSEGYREQIPYWQRQVDKPKRIWFFLIGPALTVPFLAGLLAGASHAYRLPGLCLATFGLAHLLIAWNLLPHYAGPITGAVYILLIAGFRVLLTWRRRAAVNGLAIVRASLVTVVIMLAVRTVAPALDVPVYGEYTLPWYSFGLHANRHRDGIEKKLEQIGGKHLILVDYDAGHIPDFEWVYNRADIDGSSIVWARMTPRRDLLTQLLIYFSGRRVWVIYPDQNPGRLLTFEERIR